MEAAINYYERHIGDYLKDTSHLSLLEHGVYTRLMDVYYTREGPIPEDQIARLIGARTKDERTALNAVLDEFFVLAEGAYRQARCDREIEQFLSGEPEREIKKANEDNRLKRHREERARLFKVLTDAGQHAAWNVGMNELRDMVKRITATAPETPEPPLPATAPATPATATHTHTHTQYPIPKKEKNQERASDPPRPNAREAEGNPGHGSPLPEVNGHAPTRAGMACRAMRKAGLAATNPGDPRLIALCEQGATDEEFSGLAAEAVEKGKGFAWVLAALQGRRAEAQTIALAPPPAAPPWPSVWPEVVQRGAALGMPWSELTAEGRARNRDRYRADVVSAWNQRESAQGAQA
jgi:uncharacterized protein YdaU (DUF1376 family)